jgi:hypothetical protein
MDEQSEPREQNADPNLRRPVETVKDLAPDDHERKDIKGGDGPWPFRYDDMTLKK